MLLWLFFPRAAASEREDPNKWDNATKRTVLADPPETFQTPLRLCTQRMYYAELSLMSLMMSCIFH